MFTNKRMKNLRHTPYNEIFYNSKTKLLLHAGTENHTDIKLREWSHKKRVHALWSIYMRGSAVRKLTNQRWWKSKQRSAQGGEGGVMTGRTRRPSGVDEAVLCLHLGGGYLFIDLSWKWQERSTHQQKTHSADIPFQIALLWSLQLPVRGLR